MGVEVHSGVALVGMDAQAQVGIERKSVGQQMA